MPVALNANCTFLARWAGESSYHVSWGRMDIIWWYQQVHTLRPIKYYRCVTWDICKFIFLKWPISLRYASQFQSFIIPSKYLGTNTNTHLYDVSHVYRTLTSRIQLTEIQFHLNLICLCYYSSPIVTRLTAQSRVQYIGVSIIEP